MLDADGLVVSLDQLVVRASTAPDGAQVHVWREPTERPIRLLQRRLEGSARAKRVRVTVTVVSNRELTVQQDRLDPGADIVASAMNQPASSWAISSP